MTQQDHVKVPDRCLFCVRDNVAGMGWGVPPHEALDWAEYASRAGRVDRNVIRLRQNVRPDDLVWSRDTKGKYWLARVIGEWEYRYSQGHIDADIHNVRACEWRPVGDLIRVPGTIRNRFIRGQTLESIDSDTIRSFSMGLYNRLCGQNRYGLSLDVNVDLFSLFDPDDCEDLVGIFLQLQGWLLYPGTCKKGTQGFEFVVRNHQTGKMGAAQVKQGSQELCVSEYEDFDGDVFLFQTEAKYFGAEAKKTSTTLLDPDQMRRFCIDNLKIMTPTIQWWVEWTERQR